MTSVWPDVRYALRTLGRDAGFALAVVVTLALGIGANTAVFSVVDAVLLHPLPVERPEELAAIYEGISDAQPHDHVSYLMLEAIQQRVPSLVQVAGFRAVETVVRSGGAAEQALTTAASGNYFTVLGLRPQAGRFFSVVEDAAPGASPVVVVSDAFWARRFGRSPAAVGAQLDIGGHPFTIIGVAPRGFHGTELSADDQLWVPLHMIAHLGARAPFTPDWLDRLFSSPMMRVLGVVARVRPGVPARTVVRELNTVYQQENLVHPMPSLSAMGYTGNAVELPMGLEPLVAAAALGDRADLVRFVTVLFVVVGLTLLIACVNAAHLFMGRAEARQGELSLRASLGASRVRIARQLFVESLMLALAGAGAGAVVDAAIVRLLSAFTLPGNIPLARVDLSPGVRVFVFTAGLAVVTSLLFGLLPALGASQPDLIGGLRGHGTAGRRRGRSWILGIQVAMSLMLLVGAGLFVRSLRAGLMTNLGFDPRPLATSSADPRLLGYSTSQSAAYYAEALRRAGELPGISGAAVTTHVPLAPFGFALPFTAGPRSLAAAAATVSPSYFDVLGVPILEGRGFSAADDARAPAAAILNQSAAHALFPDGHAVGRKVALAGSNLMTIVGVVRDTKYESVRDEHRPVIYLAFPQSYALWGGRLALLVRSANPSAALAEIRGELAALPPAPPIQQPGLVKDQVAAVLMPQRFGAALLGLFSVIALAICAVGIYGAVARGVGRQASEIGVRVALGAPSLHVLRTVIARPAGTIAWGIAAGMVGASLAGRALAGFLYGVTPLDGAAFLSSAGVMVLAAAAACAGPARRALRMNPLSTLREG
ncbi:MAG TPA: ADOP family duplicated permease [Gemmatimonadales bacterium]|nr:ADOP family duplicated permease [Gemmatimonadales bacterium]